MPLKVCVDCCDVLNTCNEFIEKTNQAQILLRELLVNSNSSHKEPAELKIEYAEETVQFSEHEATGDEKKMIDQNECQLSDNYINETVKQCAEETKTKEKSAEKKEEKRIKEELKEEKKSKEERKSKEEKRKRSKESKSKEKKVQKMEEAPKNQRHSTRLDKKQNDMKSSMNVVDTSGEIHSHICTSKIINYTFVS